MLSPIPVLTIRFYNGAQIPICSVADAANALADRRWPDKGGAVYREAVRMTDEALCGHCNAQAALNAVKKAAGESGILDRTPPPKK